MGRVSYSTEFHNIDLFYKYVVKCCFVDMNVQKGEQVLKQVKQEQYEPKRKEGRQPARQGAEDVNVGCT